MADKKKKTIYISGHKNPDTDSICSAMALADLKNKIAEKQMMEEISGQVVYQAVRAGHLNQETRYVMKAFDGNCTNLYERCTDTDQRYF